MAAASVASAKTFWQFRPYADGESFSRIDWRRSARDDHMYIRDREWEAAHTVWLWADMSPSMMYKSTLASVSKESRALVLMLALAEILARSGERIGCPGIMEPISARNAAERLATAIMHAPITEGLPDTRMIRGSSDIVLIGDFLDDADRVMERITPLARRGLRGHVVEVADPAEETFPYTGRTEFTDPETGEKLTSGRAETLRDDYQQAYLARRDSMSDQLRRMAGASPTTAPIASLPRPSSPSTCTCRACRLQSTGVRADVRYTPAFGAPAILGALLALPLIWWLLKLTPPRPKAEVFPPLKILAGVLKREETPSKSRGG